MGRDERDKVRGDGMPSVPLRVNVVYNETEYDIDVDAEMALNPNDLESSFLDHAGKYAFYAVVHAHAQGAVDDAKHQLEMAKATEGSRLRGVKDDKGKAPSEKRIELMLEEQEEVIKARKAYNEAKRQEAILKAVREAFVHRRDMLIQLGASERVERKDASFG